MTPQEKSNELMGIFGKYGATWTQTKIYALEAIDLLIEEQDMWQYGLSQPIKFWQEVKEIIEKNK